MGQVAKTSRCRVRQPAHHPPRFLSPPLHDAAWSFLNIGCDAMVLHSVYFRLTKLGPTAIICRARRLSIDFFFLFFSFFFFSHLSLFSSFKHTSATGVCRWVRRFGSRARHGNTARERVFVTTEAMEWSGHVGRVDYDCIISHTKLLCPFSFSFPCPVTVHCTWYLLIVSGLSEWSLIDRSGDFKVRVFGLGVPLSFFCCVLKVCKAR